MGGGTSSGSSEMKSTCSDDEWWFTAAMTEVRGHRGSGVTGTEVTVLEWVLREKLA
jgi:hypothetical protein